MLLNLCQTMKRYLFFALAATLLGANPLVVSGDTSDALTSTSSLIGVPEADDPDLAYISGGKATATIVFSSDFSSAQIGVRFSDLDGDLTHFRLSCLDNVAVGLVDRREALLDVHPNVRAAGAFIVGTLTNANLSEQARSGVTGCVDDQGQAIDSLVLLAAAIERRRIYWSLHTDAFPEAELRGLVRSVVR
jgi:hypothetical protein